MKGTKNMKKLMTVCACMVFAANAYADVITFDEIPPANGNYSFLSEEYAGLGVHFLTTDDGSIWGGLSAGDPGNWDLEGTNGPAFLGFNGNSYSLTTTFDTGMSNISLDVSRSNGSSLDDIFTLEGYSGGFLIESHTVALGDINTWSTMSLSAMNIDQMHWFGTGEGFHPYGIDNFVFMHSAVIPAPGAMLLGSIGVALVGWMRKRRTL
jgi:hypothetical protein